MEPDIYHIFQSIAPRYDRANTVISMGMHRRWKGRMVRTLSQMIPKDSRILDLCCGTGDIAWMFLKEGDSFQVTAADFSPNMLSEAGRKLSGLPGEARYCLVQADAMALPWREETFDAAVISFGLRNTPDWNRVLREMVRVTKTGGIVCVMDAHYPENIWVQRAFSLYFTWLMPVLGGGRKHRREYGWLNRSAKAFADVPRLMGMMKEAGLIHRRYKRFLFGSCVYQLGEKANKRKGTQDDGGPDGRGAGTCRAVFEAVHGGLETKRAVK